MGSFHTLVFCLSFGVGVRCGFVARCRRAVRWGAGCSGGCLEWGCVFSLCSHQLLWWTKRLINHGTGVPTVDVRFMASLFGGICSMVVCWLEVVLWVNSCRSLWAVGGPWSWGKNSLGGWGCLFWGLLYLPGSCGVCGLFLTPCLDVVSVWAQSLGWCLPLIRDDGLLCYWRFGWAALLHPATTGTSPGSADGLPLSEGVACT